MTGKEVKALRESYGLSQGDWGCLIGTSSRTVARWELALETEASLNLGSYRVLRALLAAPEKVRADILEAYDRGSWAQGQLVLLTHLVTQRARAT